MLRPITLDMNESHALDKNYHVIFMANTLHIMSKKTIEHGFKQCTNWLDNKGLLITYGPFKYQGEFTSESNAHFDEFLKTNDPNQGIRDFE